jgi:NarL family two-component system sensor histidine kinase YdfH
MPSNSSPNVPKVERDSRLFILFMAAVFVSMYVVTLVNFPATRQWVVAVPLAVLILIHLALHWQLEKITRSPRHAFWYIIGQGLLALAISWLAANNIGMSAALFMGLLGEAVGLMGLTRRGALAAGYYLILLVISMLQSVGTGFFNQALLTLVLMALFVVIYVVLYMRQNDAREQAQKLAVQLEAANRQLSEYAAQVEDLTIANERQRMARELHDTLSQGLAGIILQLEAADAHLASSRLEKARTIVANAMLQARGTLADARAAIDDLRRPALDDLDTALRREISRFTNATGIPCEFHADIQGVLPGPLLETVARIAAEALTNIARHAGASRVVIDLTVRPSALDIQISDDGSGFDPAAIPAGHYGLQGLRERILGANGKFDILSASGKGTTLKVNLPL